MTNCIAEPPIMHPNEIDAAFADMRDKGQSFIGQLGGAPLSISDWRAKEISRWQRANGDGESLKQEDGK